MESKLSTSMSFSVPFLESEKNSRENSSIQEAFENFLKERKKSTRKHRSNRQKHSIKKKSKEKSFEEKMKLRKLFVEQAFEYVGTPYARRYWTEGDAAYESKLFLDCCGLVRRVMWDLKKQFHFVLGPWNQCYFYDCLPDIENGPMDALPGDLVFIEGVHYNENARKQKHNITHVEIWLGDGEKTLASRWQKGFVQIFDSYKFVSKSYEIKRYIFKSIEPWLNGINKSHCLEHKWRKRRSFKPSKYSIFYQSSHGNSSSTSGSTISQEKQRNKTKRSESKSGKKHHKQHSQGVKHTKQVAAATLKDNRFKGKEEENEEDNDQDEDDEDEDDEDDDDDEMNCFSAGESGEEHFDNETNNGQNEFLAVLEQLQINIREFNDDENN